MPRFTFRYCPFHHTIKPILDCDMAYIGSWNGPFRKTKWCFSQNDEMPFKHKSLIFNTLLKPLIVRVFAPEGDSVRKYALIFRGRTENSEGKIKIRFQFESCTFRIILKWIKTMFIRHLKWFMWNGKMLFQYKKRFIQYKNSLFKMKKCFIPNKKRFIQDK